MTSTLHGSARRSATALALLAALAATPAAAGALERGQEARARGQIKAAQLEMRNAVRDMPQSAAARFALAEVSLELADWETAAAAAEAAMQRGYDPAAATALRLQTYLLRGRFAELLRDFPPLEDPALLIFAEI